MLLSRLDEVNWCELKHAYGTAEDVPALLRALASKQTQVRRRARWHLHRTIVHQGTRYNASAAAVPFVLALLDSPEIEDKAELIMLLVLIATGYPEAYLPRGLDMVPYRVYSANADECDDYTRWIVEAYDAVRAGVPTLIRCLSHPSEHVRLHAAFGLAWFREAAALSAPHVRAAMHSETSPRLVANAALALGLLGGYQEDGRDVGVWLRWLEGERTMMEKQAAAIALCNVLADEVPEEAVAVLLTTLQGVAHEDPLWPMPWNEGDLMGYVSLCLASLGPRALERAIPMMCETLRTLSGIPAFNVTRVLLQVLFDQLPSRRDRTQLDSAQRHVLEVLADAPQAWCVLGAPCENFAALMRDFGLPTTCHRLRTQLRHVPVDRSRAWVG